MLNSGGMNAPIRYTGLNVGSSMLDLPVPIFWGQRRLTTNAIWFNNFKSHPLSGKGKGGKQPQLFDYTAAVIIALCRGVIDSIPQIWAAGSTTTTTNLVALNMTFFSGSATQTPWSYVTTNYPAQARAYARTAYLACPNLDLGEAASIPDNAFECVRASGFAYTHGTPGWINPYTHTQATAIDCLPSDILTDFLTNVQYGMGFAAGDIGSLTQYAAWCRAQGIFFSPLLNRGEKATSIIDRWAQLSYSWIYWSGTQLQAVPLGDSAVTGNGAIYTPVQDVAYNLGLSDFLEPLKVSRKDPADCYNRTRLEITDRTVGYISNPIEYKSQTLVDRYGLRDQSSVQADEICDPLVGAVVVQLIGKRAAYLRKTYMFKTTYRYILCLPGTILTLTDPNQGLNLEPVRVVTVEEDGDNALSFTCEEFPGQLGTYNPPATATPQAFIPSSIPDQYVTPPNVNTPAIFEPNPAFTGGKPVLVIAASGGANWGGCNVNISFDGVNWDQIGTISAPAIQGTLTANLASHVDPDTTDTLSVDCAESLSAPSTAISHSDADNFRTVSIIAAQPTGTGPYVVPSNGELVAFGAVAATGTYTSNLAYLRRGLYGTAPSAHSTGDQFTVCDVSGTTSTQLQYELPPQYIGQAIYLKFTSFNPFKNSVQDIASVLEYQYTPNGLGYGSGMAGVPATPTGLAASISGTQVKLTWNANPAPDNITEYEVYRAAGTGASFGSASLVAIVSALTWTDPSLAASTGYTYFLVAVNSVGSSGNTAGVNATTGSGPTGSIGPASGGKPTNRITSNASQAPSGTLSTAGVMMGIGTVWHLTPNSTGNVRIRITALSKNAADGITNFIQLYYGTGTAPANGAAITGTAVLAQTVDATSPAAAGLTPFSIEAEITGLTLSTAYWFDLSLATGNAADQANIYTTFTSIEEF